MVALISLLLNMVASLFKSKSHAAWQTNANIRAFPALLQD
jgi:hypothetical protein